MIVSCPACATKFNIPDAKVAGKRARMKCKKCGEAISIDGTSIGGDVEAAAAVPQPAAAAPRPVAPAAPSAAAKPGAPAKPATPAAPAVAPTPPLDIATRWCVAEPSGKRQELNLDEVVRLYVEGGLESGTLVCAPGKNEWLPPYDFKEIMDRAGHKGSARAPLPTFSDETVTLSVTETEALKFQSQRLAAEPPPMRAQLDTSPNTFFGTDDVDDAMASFDAILSEAPPAAREGAEDRPTPMAPAPMAPPALPGSPPAAAAPAAPAEQAAHAAPAEPSETDADELASSEQEAPVPPPAPQAATPAAAPVSTHGAKLDVAAIAAAIPSPAAPVPSVPSAPPAPPRPPSSSAAPPLPQWEADSEPVQLSESNPPLTRAASTPPTQKKGKAGLVFLIILLLLAAGVAAVYFLQPQLFQRGVTDVKQLLGLAGAAAPAVALGPDFDKAQAGSILSTAASEVANCREPQGPTGKGRARVLFDPSGAPREVVLEKPFLDTTVGRCVIDRFMATKVPPFGGQAILVNKSFEIPE